MIATIIVIAVAALLAAVILTEGTNADHNSGRDRNWTVALHVADAGVENAVAYLQAHLQSGMAFPFTLTGSLKDGSYTTTITAFPRYKFQIDSKGVVGTVSSLRRSRLLRVIMAPPRSFKYALFSNSDINTKNNDVINGDVWANGSVEVFNGNSVNGSVNAATGWVKIDQNSCVSGDAHSGGSIAGIGIEIDGQTPQKSCNSTSNVGGNATASSSTPGCADDPGHSGYTIVNDGTIAGRALTWGNINGSGTEGVQITHVCTAAPAVKPMPTFSPSYYSPPYAQLMTVAQFQTYLVANGNALSGQFKVMGPGVIDLSGVQIAGDTTIIAVDPSGTDANPLQSASINSDGIGAANANDKILVLYSAYQPVDGTACASTGGNPGDCAVGIKNNFLPSDNTATLIYAPNGPCLFKNNAEFEGAVYCSNIIVKNDQTVTYDERIEQVVGFGSVTLQVASWQELKQ
jgi:hypothetical protein